MIWIAALFILVCAVVGAWLEGPADAETAMAGNPVEHTISPLIRVLTTIALGVLLTILANARWWNFFPLVGIAFGAFNPYFRWTMNKARGKDWRYVSPSNAYDRMFLRTRMKWGAGVSKWIQYHAAMYGKDPDYTWMVHRCGLYAYIAEVLTLLASVFLLTLNP